jgi:hypothetical protein
MSARVLSQEDQTPVVGAYVRLTDLKLGKEIVTATDTTGSFAIHNLNKDATYKGTISSTGFEMFSFEVLIDKQTIVLPNFYLKTKVEVLNEVIVEGKAEAVRQSGDTLIYNAEAYKTHPDAVAEDLVKKLPGVTAEDGVVKSQGKEVRKILIDGEEFFGSDPNTALKNLPADIIKNVQVFDDKSDRAKLTGFDDGVTIRTINFVTRRGVSTGKFGKFETGYGLKDRYTAGGNFNHFTKTQKISLLGGSNNFNNNNSLDNSVSTRPQKGISTINTGGINFNKNAKNLTTMANYMYNGVNGRNITNTDRQYYIPFAGNQLYRDENSSKVSTANHLLMARVDYRPNFMNSISFTPRLHSVQMETDGTQNINNRSFEGMLLSQTVNNRQSKSNNYSVSLPIMYRVMGQKKRGRSLMVDAATSFSRNDGDQRLLFIQYNEAGDETSQNRVNSTAVKGSGISASVYFTEPVKKGSGQLEYSISNENSESKNYTYTVEEVGTTLDPRLSNVYSVSNLVQRARVAYQWNIKNMMVTFGSTLQLRNLSGKQILPIPTSVNTTYYNVLPDFAINYPMGLKGHVDLQYRTDTNAPTMYDLQDVYDYTNPTRVYRGNSRLNQQYNHQLNFIYNRFKTEKSRSFSITVNGRFVNDVIGNTSQIIQRDTVVQESLVLVKGAEVRFPVNLRHSLNLTSTISYGLPISLIKSNLNVHLNASYRSIPGVINGVENISNLYGIGPGLYLSSNFSKDIDFSLSPRVNYYSVKNTIQSNTDYWGGSISGKLNLRFAKSFVFRSEAAIVLFTRFNTSSGLNYFLLNASLGKKIFANQLGEVKLSVADAMNNNQGVQYNATESYSEYVQSLVIKRVVLLSFVYNLRNFK